MQSIGLHHLQGEFYTTFILYSFFSILYSLTQNNNALSIDGEGVVFIWFYFSQAT